MEKLYIENKSFHQIKNDLINGKYKSKQIFNFVNANSIYLFKKNRRFRESIVRKENINFPDGFTVSLFLSTTNFVKVNRNKGPNFTFDFLNDKGLNKNKKHLFVGLDSNSLSKLKKKFPGLNSKNIFYYEIPMIKEKKYNDFELVNKINLIKPDYIWVGIGNPKQEILSNDIIEKIQKGVVFNVGAAFDYIKDKKMKAPKIYENLGIEWLYRTFTDFRHTFPKVIRSFVGQFYLPYIVRLKK